MAGDFDYLHIKQHTAGSSNELSFDVLDNARNGFDKKKSRSARLPKPPKASQGSYHGVKGTATLSSQAEVKKRKKARKVHAIRVWIVAIVVAFALAFGLLWFGYNRYVEVQDFSTRFNLLINQFVEEDEFLSQVDTLMKGIDDPTLLSDRAEILSKIPEVIKDVERIEKNAESAKPLTVTDQDEVALAKIIDTADARIEMLQKAQAAFLKVAEREEKKQEAAKIWNEIVAEGQQAKEASSEANKADKESKVQEARDKTKEVLDKMKTSQAALQDFAKKNPAIDVSPQLSYIEKKIQSLQYAVQTGDALLEGDRTKAAEKNEAYNDADKESAELAKDLPVSIDEEVVAAYEDEIAKLVQQYNDARDRVIESDALIRSYLSTR